ncbi:hypothetical protein [Streptomyces sp. NPDC087307]
MVSVDGFGRMDVGRGRLASYARFDARARVELLPGRAVTPPS